MFNCYLHGWSSRESACPACNTPNSNSSGTIKVLQQPDINQALTEIKELKLILKKVDNFGLFHYDDCAVEESDKNECTCGMYELEDLVRDAVRGVKNE